MSTVTTIAEAAKSAASKLNISKYDIYGAAVDEVSVQVDSGEPDQMKASQRSSVTVRVWNDANTVGITSTTDVDPVGLELALKTAHEASFFGVKDNAPDFSPEATAATHGKSGGKHPQAPVTELVDKLLGAEKELLAAHEAIAAVPYNGLAQRDIDRFYINSAGAMREDNHSVASVYLYTKTEEEGKKPRSAGAFRVSEGVAQLDVAACLKETAEKTISHLNYDKIKTGKYQVVFSAEAFLSLLGAFSNLYNAQSILDKQSLSTAESLGEMIASPLLCVTDDALHPENVGGETFDGEGTPTRPVPLIVNGELKNFLHSAGTAKRMDAQPTGNANMGAKVTVSPNFFHVFASDVKPEQTYSLDDADNVILIDDLQALHAGVQALQGSFSLPFDGWLIKDGKRVSVESATVAGDIREVLKSIVYVESETEFTGSGVCPRVWVKELSGTGEE
ncbi:TldD/PmbA family protein [filamentous cyanobacterium LEGE 11480]|uniref:TldD/PmbA family protein n=1 Tax=Romeriopsis navalis LEGE 11480 TaxID=2777977 RepID=A0A928VNH8_9CYAN|nr:TldD/PmbA family protein [Romeriopsis navalis]MBE9031843.1 TldD/PmbA family protein [Romeriopsis navalis LEGE 11480]